MMLVGYGAVFLSIWLVAGMVQSDPSVVGSIASFVNYLSQIIFTIVMVGFLGNSVSRAMISMRRIREILDAEPAMTFKDIPDEELVGSLSFENVTFTYPMDKEPMLKDVSFTIEPGQMVGVVGATGAGKSTLAQLIPRLFDPQDGAIKIGGKDIREVSEGTLRKTVSIVLQRAILFSGTIADNLRQGREMLLYLKWSAQPILPRLVNSFIVWRKPLKVQLKNGEPISLVDKNKGCRLRVGLSAIHVF